MDADFEKVSRIVIRGVNWVGDTILTYPAVQRLRARFPHSHVAVLVRDNLVDLWRTFPYVNEVIPFGQGRGWKGLQGDIRLGLDLAKKRFDLAVIFPRSFRSAYPIYLARIPLRVGYRNGVRNLFLTHRVPLSEAALRVHRVHHYQRLMDSFGVDERLSPPKIFLSEKDREKARDRMKDLSLPPGRLLIGMNPGATYGLAKCWLPDRFGALGRRLVQERDAFILLFGKEEERPVTQEILRSFEGNGADLTGRTRLLELAAVLEQCRLLVTNDTGTMHVAAAVGTPVVAIFGPTDSVATGPWGEGHAVVKREIPCSPCLKRVCPQDHRCMRDITVDEVEEVVVRQLGSLKG